MYVMQSIYVNNDTKSCISDAMTTKCLKSIQQENAKFKDKPYR